jgi:sensor histidine kinase YesM
MAKYWVEVAINILFWILTGWLITSGFSIESQEVSIKDGVQTVNIVRNEDILIRLHYIIGLSFLFFYINFWNISRFLQKEKSSQILLLTLAFLVIPFFLFKFSHNLIQDSLIKLPDSLIFGIFFFYFSISIAYSIGKVLQQSEQQKQQLALEKKQAQLTLLRAQLHPHFLFNVLNNLLSMVDQKKNPELTASLDRLSGLLRYVVYDTDGNVPVKKEIEFIRNFMDLQIQRFEKDEIDFKLVVNGPHNLQMIEPGIFIPFVENIFKYGAEPEKSSRIVIQFDLTQSDKIIFESSNPIYPTLQQNKGSGSGISSTKARLALVYPNNHRLTITENESFNVKLEIQTNESNNS